MRRMQVSTHGASVHVRMHFWWCAADFVGTASHAPKFGLCFCLRRVRRNPCDISGIVSGLPTIGWHQSLAYRLPLSGRSYATMAGDVFHSHLRARDIVVFVAPVRKFASAVFRSRGRSVVPYVSRIPALTPLVLSEGADRHLHPKTANHVRIRGSSSSQQRHGAAKASSHRFCGSGWISRGTGGGNCCPFASCLLRSSLVYDSRIHSLTSP